MTKTQFQQELLEKVKEGVKPSDLKKQQTKLSQTPLSSSPRSISRSDEGYESDQSDKIPTTPPLNQTLQTQISSLQKQLQLYKDFRESDLKIKEGYKERISKLQQENSTLKQTIANLQKAKPTVEPQLTEKKKEPKLYFFTCSICDQNKKSQLHLAKVNGLGIDPTKLQKICDYCIKRVDLIKEREEDFF